MKDQMFFIFTILYLTCSAWITDHKAPFCSVDKGTQLLYQIDSEQAERYYSNRRQKRSKTLIRCQSFTIQEPFGIKNELWSFPLFHLPLPVYKSM